MLDLDRATTLESSRISIPRETDWIPKATGGCTPSSDLKARNGEAVYKSQLP
jgi:hypothetical protein